MIFCAGEPVETDGWFWKCPVYQGEALFCVTAAVNSNGMAKQVAEAIACALNAIQEDSGIEFFDIRGAG